MPRRFVLSSSMSIWLKQHTWFSLGAGLLMGLVLFFLMTGSVVQAKTTKTINDFNTALNTAVQPTGIEQKFLSTSIAEIIQAALGLVGLIFLVLVIAGGMKKLLSTSEEDAKKANDLLTAAVIGLFIVGSAYGVSAYVTDTIITAPSGPTTAGDVADAPKGCCMDKVSDGGILDGVWACRITTEADCQYVGEQKDDQGQCVGDNFCSAADWSWVPGDDVSVEECQAFCL